MRSVPLRRPNCGVRARTKSSTNYAGVPMVSIADGADGSRHAIASRARRHSQTRCEQPGSWCVRSGARDSSARRCAERRYGLDRFDIVICVSGHAVAFRARSVRCAAATTSRADVDRRGCGNRACARRTRNRRAATGERIVGRYTGARAAQSSSRAARADLRGSRWTAAAGGGTDADAARASRRWRCTNGFLYRRKA